MATSTVTDWDEIEADPDFSSLPQESRVRMFDDWERNFNRTLLEDADLDKVKPEGLNRFAATNAVRRRKLAGEDVSDPDAAAKTWAEQKQAEAKLAQQSLKDYADVEDKKFRLNDARSMPGVDEFGQASPEWEEGVSKASQNLEAAEAKFTPEVREQAKAANEALKGERKIATLQGNIYTDPALVLNKDEFRQQVLDSDASPEAKALKLASFQSEKKRYLDEAANTLTKGDPQIPLAESFPKFLESKGFNLDREMVQQSEGKLDYSPIQKQRELTQEYLTKMQDRGWFRKIGSAIATGVATGMLDIGTQAVGTAAMLTGDEEKSKIAAELSRASGDIGAAQGLEGDMQATGGTFAGGVSRLGTGMAPMLLPGGAVGGIARLAGAGAGAATAAAVGASALTAGAQTAGSQFGEVYDHLRRQGSTHEQAFGVSRNAAVLSGAVTTALTALGGATGVESLLRQGGKDLVKNRLLSALKAVPGGAAAEIAEELPDEYISQLVSAFAKDPNVSPSQVTDEFAANAPDLMLQIAALGGAGAGVGRFRETTTDPAKAREAEFPTAGAPPPLKPQDYENRAAGGQPIFNEEGDVIGVAPPGATPEETAAYREEIRSAAKAAIPEVVEPIDGVDPAITEEMDARLAAGKASGLADQTLAELERQKAAQGAPAPVAEAPTPKRPLANLTDEELEQRIQDSSRLANETAVEGSPDAAFFTNAAEKYRAEKARRVAATTQAATPAPAAETLGVTSPPAPTLETPEGAARNAPKPKATQTASGKKLGDKIVDGENVAIVNEYDQSTPGMPTELTVLEVDGIVDAKSNKVFATRRDMTPNEITVAQEKIRQRNALAKEMGMPQEEIPQPITPQGAAPTTATEGQPMPGGSSEAEWTPTVNAPAAFTASNGQKLVGTVQSIKDGKAVVSFLWNGNENTQTVPVSQLARPVASLTEPPKYQYTQEQNTRKMGKHFPTAPGVYTNYNFRKAFASMAKDTSLSRIYRMLAKVMSKMPVFANMDLHVVADGDVRYAGEYSFSNGRSAIAVNLRQVGRGKVDALGTILHEALHHLTLAKVRDPQNAWENEIIDKLDTIRGRVLEYAQQNGLGERFDYELDTVEEFISAVFTRPDFQNFLASIPDSFAPGVAVGKFRSVLSEIFRRLAELVTGEMVAKGSTMEQAMTSVLALFETPHRAVETGKLEALNAARSGTGTAKSLADDAMDAEYMAAVESGDVAKQQSMVDAAYSDFVRNTVMLGDRFYPATFIRFGNPPTNTEGSQVASTGFDGGIREKGVSVIGAWHDTVRDKYVIPTGSEQAVAGVSDLVAQNRPVFVVSGSVVKDVGSDTEPLMEAGTVKTQKQLNYSDLIEENNPDFTLDGEQYDSGEEGTKNAYTGGKERWWKSKGMPFPSLKNITYKDGKPVPLSQRFNPKSNSTLYSLAEEPERQLEGANMGRAMEMLGASLYAKNVSGTIGKEVFQNAVDAVMKNENGKARTIWYGQPDANHFVVADTGTGMNPDIIVDKFLRAFVSGKDVGAGGGFGLAKLAFLGSPRKFRIISVGTSTDGRKVKTTLQGTGKSFLHFNEHPPRIRFQPDTDITLAPGFTMRFSYEDAQALPTGTAMEFDMDEPYNASSAISAGMEYVEGVQSSGIKKGTTDLGYGNKATGDELLREMGYSSARSDESMAATLSSSKPYTVLHSFSTPSADVDVIVREGAKIKKTRFSYVPVLNRSIFQFSTSFNLNNEVALPEGLVVNIKPKVRAGTADYPFTTNRESVTDSVKREIERFFQEAGARENAKLNAKYANAIDSAAPIPGTGKVLLDTASTLPPALLDDLTNSASVQRALGDVTKIQDAILSMLGRKFGPKFQRAKFAGLITGARAYGVHFGKPGSLEPTAIYHDIWKEMAMAEEEFSVLHENDPAVKDLGVDDQMRLMYDTFLTKVTGVAFHEALHQDVDSEGEPLARELTFKAGDIVDAVVSLLNNTHTQDEINTTINDLIAQKRRIDTYEDSQAASEFVTAQGGYDGYAMAERGQAQGSREGSGKAGARVGTAPFSPADDAMDAEYMAAVEAGDVAKQQAMVDAAAKAAGYDIGPVYHGTEQKGLTEFYGGWWSDTKKVAREFGSQRYTAFLKGPLADGDTLRDLYKKFRGDDIDPDSGEPLYDSEIADIAMSGSRFGDYVRAAGYQGIEVWDESNAETGMAYAVFDPNQIKSADPITRDEQGNVIPLSQRFNPKSNSTLYSPADDSEPFYSKLAQVVEQKMPNRADAQTIKGIINNTQTGIKAEEIKWSGIVPWLESQTGPITKQAVLDYLAADGAVRLEEVRMDDSNAVSADEARQYFGIAKREWDAMTPESRADMIKDASERKKRVHTRYQQYQLPGGENYREVVLAMPLQFQKTTPSKLTDQYNRGVITQAEYFQRLESLVEPSGGNYTSSHFRDVPNYVAHMRMNDRTDAEGKPGAFIEEIQSDRHQAGREKGYKINTRSPNTIIKDTDKVLGELRSRTGEYIPTDEHWATHPDLSAKWDALTSELEQARQDVGRVPDAPFRTTWPLQMFKRALADAVAAGKQWIGWTTGETQAERYDLSKQIKEVAYYWDGPGDPDGQLVAVNHQGQEVMNQHSLKPDALADYIGKETAEKLVNAPDQNGMRKLSGLDLKVGGEGMKGFYDNILPKEIGKYVKQWSGRVEQTELVTGETKVDDSEWKRRNYPGVPWDAEMRAEYERHQKPIVEKAPIWRVDITPQMKAGVRSGQTLFSPADESDQRESDAVLGVMMEDDRFEEGVKMYDKAKRRQLGSPPQPSANTSTPPRFTNSAQFAAAFEAAYLRGDFDYFLEALKQADRHIYVPEMKRYINASKLGDKDAAERLEWFRHAIAGTIPANVKPQTKTPPPPQPSSAGAPPVGMPPPPPAATPPPKAGVSNRPMLTLNTAAMGMIAKMLGANVRINTLLRRARGRIKISMADGSKIELSKQLFKDPVQAAKTLAHEIGHLFDFLPASGFGKKLAGRIAPLGNFRKVFGDDLADWSMDGGKKMKLSKINQLIIDELVGLSKKWRGDFTYQPGTYRSLGSELYADFISAILNDPMWTAKNAPYATLGFLNALEQKPEVDQAYQLVISLVQGGSLYKALAEANRGKSTTALERLIAKSSALMRTKKVLKDAARGLYRSMFGSWLPTAIRDGGIWKSYWKRLKNMGTSGDYNWAQEEASQFAVRHITQFDNDMAKAVGIPLKLAGIDPEYLQRLQTNNRIIHERRRVGKLIEEDPAKARQLLKWMVDAGLLGKDVQDEVDATPDDGLYKKTAEVIYKLHASGDGFERALKAARRKGAPADAEKALYAFDVSGFMLNPNVFTMESAEADNADIEKTLGPDQFGELERINEGYHDLIKRTMVQAYKMGLFRQSTWDDVIVPNFGVYVPFMPIKYFTGYVKGGVGPARVGTANDLMAPHVVGIRKMHALINRMQRQKQALLLIDVFNNMGLHNELEPVEDENFDRQKAEELVKQSKNTISYVSYWDRGEYKWVKVNGTDAVPLVMNSDPDDLAAVYQLLKANTRLWRMNFTIFSIAFNVANTLRNIATPSVDVGPKAGYKAAKELLSIFPQMGKWVWAKMAGRDMTSIVAASISIEHAMHKPGMPVSKELQEFYDRGILQPSPDVASLRMTQEELARSVMGALSSPELLLHGGHKAAKDLNWFDKTLKQYFYSAVDALSFLGSVSEAAPKIAAYRALKEKMVPEKITATRANGKTTVTGLNPDGTRKMVPAFTDAQATYLATLEGIPRPGVGGSDNALWEMVLLFFRIMGQSWRKHLIMATAPQTRAGFLMRHMLFQGAKFGLQAMAANGVIDYLIALGAAAAAGGDDDDIEKYKQVDWAEAVSRQSDHKLSRGGVGPLICWVLPDGSIEPPYGHKSIPADWVPIMPRLPGTEFSRELDPMSYYATSKTIAPTIAPVNDDVFWNDYMRGLVSLNPAFDVVSDAMSIVGPTPPRDSYRGREKVEQRVWDEGYIARMLGLGEHHLRSFGIGSNPYDTPLPGAWNVLKKPGFKTLLSSDNMVGVREERRARREDDLTSSFAQNMVGEKFGTLKNTFNRLKGKATPRTKQEEEIYNILKPVMSKQFYGTQKNDGMYDVLQSYARMKAQGLQDTPGGKLLKAEADQVVKDLEQTADELQKPLEYLRTHTLP